MSTEKMREQLRKFYTDSFAKSLKIRKAKKNVILYQSLGGNERTVIARFDMGFADASGVENTCSLAVRMADACKDAVLGHLVDVEMGKLDDKVAEAKAEPTVLVNTVPPAAGIISVINDDGIREDKASALSLLATVQEPVKDTLASFLGQ
jgi:hypothetical protein